jgi:HEPN domain-containing protein
MSLDKNRHEAERWFQTAAEDLKAAQVLRDNRIYAQACFLSQQCGEKALKAMWFLIDRDPWGRSVQRLVREFPRADVIPDMEDWLQRAATLDRFYLFTRYPNGLPDLTPGQSYFKQDADQAIDHATFFLSSARGFLTQSQPEEKDGPGSKL